MKKLILAAMMFYSGLAVTLFGCGDGKKESSAVVAQEAEKPLVSFSCTKGSGFHIITVYGCEAAQNEINIQCKSSLGWSFWYKTDCPGHSGESLIVCECPNLYQP